MKCRMLSDECICNECEVKGSDNISIIAEKCICIKCGVKDCKGTTSDCKNIKKN